VEREPDRVLVRTQYPIEPFAGQRLDKAGSIARIRVDTVRHEGTGAGRIVRPVAKGADAVVVQVKRALQAVCDAIFDFGAALPKVEIAARLAVVARDPLLELAHALRMRIGRVDI